MPKKKRVTAYKKVILEELVGLRFPFSTSNLKFETVPALCILSSKNFSKPDKELTVYVLPSELACIKNAGVYSCALFYSRLSLNGQLYKTDTSVKRTLIAGPCLCLFPLFDSL